MPKGRTPLSAEEKEQAKAFRESEAGLQATAEKLKEKEAEILTKIAMKRHPEIKDAMGLVGGLYKEVSKLQTAANSSVDAQMDKERNRIEKRLETAQKKVQELQAEIASLTPDTVVSGIKAERQVVLGKLKGAIQDTEPSFSTAGISVYQIFPGLGGIKGEIDSATVPAPEPTT